jgi:hypothetical protein
MSSVFAVLTASTTAFAATNLDDLFLLTVFFGRRVPSRWIVAGQYLGRVPGAHDMESAAVDGRRWGRRGWHSLDFRVSHDCGKWLGSGFLLTARA